MENEEIRDKYKALFKEVFSKLGNKHTNIVVVGTVLHPRSLLVDLETNPGYRTRKYKAIISWSERNDLWDKWKDLYTNLDVPDEERIEKAQKFYLDNQVDMLKGTKVLWPEHELSLIHI